MKQGCRPRCGLLSSKWVGGLWGNMSNEKAGREGEREGECEGSFVCALIWIGSDMIFLVVIIGHGIVITIDTAVSRGDAWDICTGQCCCRRTMLDVEEGEEQVGVDVMQ